MKLLLISLSIIISIFIIKYEIMKFKFKKSAYGEETSNKFFKVFRDKGLYGEYLTFEKLEKVSGDKKILANLYIPKGDKTTEIDLVMIHETGIYVLESKNYSGWIFGNDKDRYWMQVINKNEKNKFYNPIKQNNSHVKYLAKLLDNDTYNYISIIAFSERCTLKKITNESDAIILNRDKLDAEMINRIKDKERKLTKEEIEIIYNILKSYTQVSEEEKQNHIKNIKVNVK